MAFKALTNCLGGIAIIIMIGGIQSSTLDQLSSQQNTSIQSDDFFTKPKSRRNVSTLTEQKNNRMKVVSEVPSLGFRNVLANYAFIEFLQYFGDEEARRETGYHNSAEYLSTAIHHDPYFKEFYIFLSGSSTLYAGMPKETVEIISEGLARFGENRPADSYYIWRYKGTDELLFLNDGKSAQTSFEMAADWALKTSGEEARMIARISQQTASFLSENPNSQLAQISAWGNVLTTAIDAQTRNRAIKQIRELGGDVILTENGQARITLSEASEDHENADI